MKLHDAAFDAYMTGYVFAMLTKRIEIQKLLGSVDIAKEETKQAAGNKRQQKKAAKDDIKVKVAGGFESVSGAATPIRQLRSGKQAAEDSLEDLQILSRSQSAIESARGTPTKGKRGRAVHYTALQNQPIEICMLDMIKNKLNLIVHVPSYLPLDSDSL
mmetsp:Transcript_5220/g.6962  ORF Transcript_5220/g.6962 Transcript_5220/m.6962 type:complete len:159 (-) Transcript_5220:248-724(-)|eukprot:CAMPEP_0185599756 /NCGR_PEP_ID=MMETSP0434-20130131/82916_1 /TAXON_ID=626734 ORGANISM="Favella taraikaensis, Strain Fe Narragansett Bay" /NCGR_SAMPLE_ID=MMETSP0434 /ASSEMBLY_ACC=CAM_ASM_000379 /LENGTH=158 /DNA_ID=CAMNT_0028229259 /DNA_START=1215 /DNA_END=1691 /DNA_ORIENTATION=+